MARTLIANVVILDPEAPGGYTGPLTIVVDGDRIDSLEASSTVVSLPGDRVIDGTGRLAAPGLVNAHTHSQSSTMPGFGDRLSHPAFMWLTQAHTSRRTPEEIRLAVLLTAWGMLTTGTTATIDHFPGQRFDLADMDAVLSAWEETGLRVALGMRFFDGTFADIIPASLPASMKARLDGIELLKPQPFEGLEDLFTAVISRWHGRAGRISVFPAPSNPDRCSDAALQVCAALAERHDLGIHTHLLETRRQAELARDRYGIGTLAHLERLGVLSDRWSCAHCIWLDDAEIALMAKYGMTAVLNPESNASLGTGLAPVPALRSAGVSLALGTDGAGSNDNLAMHEAMRMAATAHRATEPDRRTWMSAQEAFAMATTGGARAMRVPGLGRLAPGAPADLVLYRLETPAWTPMNDATAQFVFAETGAGVDLVMVAGDVLLEGGRPLRLDPRELTREVSAMAKSLRIRNRELFDAAESVAGLT